MIPIYMVGLLTFKMLFRSPKSLLRLIRNLTKKGDGVIDKEDYAELYSIGVSRNTQGMGVGKKILIENMKTTLGMFGKNGLRV